MVRARRRARTSRKESKKKSKKESKKERKGKSPKCAKHVRATFWRFRTSARRCGGKHI